MMNCRLLFRFSRFERQLRELSFGFFDSKMQRCENIFVARDEVFFYFDEGKIKKKEKKNRKIKNEKLSNF